MKAKLQFKLFSVFFKIGAIAFGGGYAVASLPRRDAVRTPVRRTGINTAPFILIFAAAGIIPS